MIEYARLRWRLPDRVGQVPDTCDGQTRMGALHLSASPDQAFFDDLDLGAASGSREAEADEWAQEMLIPSKEWTASSAFMRPSAYSIIELAQQLDIHVSIVAGRVRRARQNYRAFSSFVGTGQIRKHFFKVPEKALEEDRFKAHTRKRLGPKSGTGVRNRRSGSLSTAR
jgi:hypothetical protein